MDDSYLHKPRVNCVLRLLKRGAEPAWVPLSTDTAAPRHPLWPKRVDAMRRSLGSYYLEETSDLLLSSPAPGEVRLPNLANTIEHHHFVTKRIRDLLASRRVAEWWWPGGQTCHCILALGVDQSPISGKLRLIFDARFLNLWHAYESFLYETVLDIPFYAQAGGFATTSDIKPGYQSC